VLIEDLADGVARWSTHADQIALGPPWYGMEPAEQTALFRDILRRLRTL
jgi:hypothetical protein